MHAQPDDPTGPKLAMIGASDWLRVQQQTSPPNLSGEAARQSH